MLSKIITLCFVFALLAGCATPPQPSPNTTPIITRDQPGWTEVSLDGIVATPADKETFGPDRQFNIAYDPHQLPTTGGGCIKKYSLFVYNQNRWPGLITITYDRAIGVCDHTDISVATVTIETSGPTYYPIIGGYTYTVSRDHPIEVALDRLPTKCIGEPPAAVLLEYENYKATLTLLDADSLP